MLFINLVMSFVSLSLSYYSLYCLLIKLERWLCICYRHYAESQISWVSCLLTGPTTPPVGFVTSWRWPVGTDIIIVLLPDGWLRWRTQLLSSGQIPDCRNVALTHLLYLWSGGAILKCKKYELIYCCIKIAK